MSFVYIVRVGIASHVLLTIKMLSRYKYSVIVNPLQVLRFDIYALNHGVSFTLYHMN